jgi:mannose-6-phosphate isomerase
MSFMFNPHPFYDPAPVNRPKLSEKTVDSIVSGTKEAAEFIGELVK